MPDNIKKYYPLSDQRYYVHMVYKGRRSVRIIIGLASVLDYLAKRPGATNIDIHLYEEDK
jgi:hypothetical protein